MFFGVLLYCIFRTELAHLIISQLKKGTRWGMTWKHNQLKQFTEHGAMGKDASASNCKEIQSITIVLRTRQNGRDKFHCFRRFHDQGRSSDNFENLARFLNLSDMMDLGREIDGNNEICLGVRFATTRWYLSTVPGTVVTHNFFSRASLLTSVF